MKNFLKYVAALAIVGAFFVACSDWTDPEREITQHPDQQSPILRDNAYYQALREYKKTKHKIAFGWYGSWTAVGASYQTRLQSAPDSMDIISIWSQWHSLTPEQIADKEFVQKIKGTKVTFTIFSDKMPEPFLTEIGGGEYTDEAIEAYVEREKPFDCAGAAKIERLGIALMESVKSDDPTSLIGLPLMALTTLLTRAGVEVLPGLDA